MMELIIALIILILFFLLGRELICWYFKINQRVDLLQEISEKLDYLQRTPKG